MVYPKPKEEIIEEVTGGKKDDKKNAYPLTDDGNARRLVAEHGADLRYCEEQGIWYAWNGRRWAPSKGVAVEARAKKTVRAFYFNASSEEQRKHARRSQNAPQILNMVRLARSEADVAIEITQLDAHPWLVGCINGVIDLRTGVLSPHDRKYLITKIAPVEYDPEARFEIWEEYLDSATDGNEEIQGFLRRAAGCSLSGAPADDDRFFFIHGPPGSGKTTFVEAILAAFGSYGQAAAFDMLLKHYNVGGTRPDLVRLRGARFVSVIEASDKRLDEEMLKRLTGGDTIAAHGKYQDEIEFTPCCKLWIAGNHEPIIRDGDSALWRRLLKVPFTHVIDEKDRDPQVKETLRQNRAAHNAVFAWAVKGCLEWRERGNLGAPAAVAEATRIYRDSQDLICQFLDECCERGPYREFELGEGYQAFSAWCKDAGIFRHDVTRTKFTRRVKAILGGPTERKSGVRRYVVGIDLLPNVGRQERICEGRDEHRDGPDGGAAEF